MPPAAKTFPGVFTPNIGVLAALWVGFLWHSFYNHRYIPFPAAQELSLYLMVF